MTNSQLDMLAARCSMILTCTYTLKELAALEDEQLTNELRDYVNLEVLRGSIRMINNGVDRIAEQYGLEVQK